MEWMVWIGMEVTSGSKRITGSRGFFQNIECEDFHLQGRDTVEPVRKLPTF